MQQVIGASNYAVGQGSAMQITLPTNGKYYYVGINSIIAGVAHEKGLECEVVEFAGASEACTGPNINDLAHKGFPIRVNGISVVHFIHKIATEDEGNEVF